MTPETRYDAKILTKTNHLGNLANEINQIRAGAATDQLNISEVIY